MSKRSFKPLLTVLSAAVVASCGLVPGSNPLGGGEGKPIVFANPNQLVAVEMTFQDRKQVQGLADAGVDFWSIDRKGKRLKTALDQAQYETALRLGLTITRRNDRFLKNTFDKGYHTYDSMLADLQAVAARYPQLVELVDIGDGWEKTQGKANRDLWAIHFKKAGAGKPTVLFAGCHHARELVTPEMVLGMVHHLAEGYGKDAEVTSAVDGRDIWLVPMVNPDGHALAEKGANQRKNTNNVTGGKSRPGVDLNRNYDAAWGTAGDSGHPESDTFRGSKAFSEPETQAMRDLMLRIKPVMFLTFHSFANTVMWSWDKTTAPPPDKRLEPVGKALGKLSGYDAYQGSQMYVNSGDDVDWAFEKLGTLAYTVEIGSYNDGFDPPFSRIPQFWNENRPMMLYTLKIADNPGAVFGPEVSQPTVAGDRLSIAGKAPVVAAEYFVGRPGAAGTGTPLRVDGLTGTGLVSRTEARQLLYVHAKGPNGAWGPYETTWTR